jgi:hypothetical protein
MEIKMKYTRKMCAKLRRRKQKKGRKQRGKERKEY